MTPRDVNGKSVNNSQFMEQPHLSSLHFEGINLPVTLIDCDELFPMLKAIFRDSSIHKVSLTAESSFHITLKKTEKGYQRSSLWLEVPVIHPDPVDAVCDLTVDLIHSFVTDHPGYLCLHSAASLFNRGLFLFPSTYRSGKSTLSLHLAFNGVPLITDDALPVASETNEGMATALYPRLRLPLPDSVSPEFRNYIKQRVALRNDRYCYVALDHSEQLCLGTMAPIAGIVLLDLDLDCPETVLERTSKKEVIKEIILRNFARQNKAIDIVERIYAIAETAECYRLTYENPDKAAKLLIENFHSE